MDAARPTTPPRAPGNTLARDEASADTSADQPPEPGPDRRSIVTLIDDAADALAPATLAWLDDALRRALDVALLLEHAPPAGHEVRVRIVADDEMAALHAAHTGDPATTDVLTFDLRDDDHAPLDVDIVVCADEARRQADERNAPIERELLLYALHGVLHCLGHDDHDDHAFDRMHAREDEILTRIGVGPTFDARAGEASS